MSRRPYAPRRSLPFLEDRPLLAALLIAGGLTLIRLVLLPFYQTSLGPDEAQYWLWSRDFDWGYYSKPPMIAWVIGASTALFGDHEVTVRLLSPVLIGGAALALFGVGQRLYGDRVGLWALLSWLLLPVVVLGSTLMSTDIPLLFWWCLSLLFFVRLADAPAGRGTADAIGLGAALGLGLLSKYAMIYFFLGWALAAILSPLARRTMRPRMMLVVGVIAAGIFTPNIVWNFQNGLQTLSHTADNANWSGQMFNPEELGQFVGDQFGVIGPFLFLAFLAYVFSMPWRLKAAGEQRGRDLLLLSFAVPPLLLICGQAFLSRAHANWALTAYPAAIVLLSAWLVRARWQWVMGLAAAVHAVVAIVFVAMITDFSLADRLGLSNAVKRLRGWEEQAAEIAAQSEGFDSVVVDDREVAAHLVWEWRDKDVPLAVFDLNGRPDNTYEYEFPFAPQAEGRYLLVRYWPQGLCKYDDFTLTPLGQSFVDLRSERRGRPERTFDLYEMTGYAPDAGDDC